MPIHRAAMDIVEEDPRYAAYRGHLDDALRQRKYDQLREKFFLPPRDLGYYTDALEAAGFEIQAVDYVPLEVQFEEWYEFLSTYHEGVLGWVGGSARIDGNEPTAQAITDRLRLIREALNRVFDGAPRSWRVGPIFVAATEGRTRISDRHQSQGASDAAILSTGMYVPAKEINNELLRERYSARPGGMGRQIPGADRHHAALARAPQDWATSDLAVVAAKKALERANLDPQDIDLIILGTEFPDYVVPGTSLVVQHKLGAIERRHLRHQLRLRLVSHRPGQRRRDDQGHARHATRC